MDYELRGATKLFEEVEKIRRGCEARVSHLARNRKCLSCGLEFMPKRFEPCPECGSKNTRLMKQKRKCLDCEHRWIPDASVDLCTYCGSEATVSKPKTDPYMTNVAVPRLRSEEDFFESRVKELVGVHIVWPWAERVKGCGLTSLARILSRCDILKLETVSEMWAHCGRGLDKEGKPQRKHRGQAITYDPQLQSACVMMGENLLRQQGKYYGYYLDQRSTMTALSPGHSHNRAFRHMTKLFTSHLWETWRKGMGLPAPRPYVFDILKHAGGHFISPEDMCDKPVSPRKTGTKRRARKQKVA